MGIRERELVLLRKGKTDAGKSGGPMYTIKDFAAIAGVDEKSLRKHIGASGPEPEMARQGLSGGYRNYYRLDALKAWWAGLDTETKKKIRGEA